MDLNTLRFAHIAESFGECFLSPPVMLLKFNYVWLSAILLVPPTKRLTVELLTQKSPLFGQSVIWRVDIASTDKFIKSKVIVIEECQHLRYFLPLIVTNFCFYKLQNSVSSSGLRLKEIFNLRCDPSKRFEGQPKYQVDF